MQEAHRNELVIEPGTLKKFGDLDHVIEEVAPIRGPSLLAVGRHREGISIDQERRAIDPGRWSLPQRGDHVRRVDELATSHQSSIHPFLVLVTFFRRR
jgi:hypothetical protein